MKQILWLMLMIVCISCGKTSNKPPDVYELPLNNTLAKTTGFNVTVSVEVYPHVASNGTFFSINSYSSNIVSVDYTITTSWTDDVGKKWVYDAKMPNGFTQWTTSTTIPAWQYYHITDAKIIGVKCSDSKYTFKF